MNNNKEGFVYLVEFVGSGRYKIGLTRNILERLKSLGQFNEVRLVSTIGTQDCYKLEKYFHSLFKEKFIGSELFLLTEKDINYFEKFSKDYKNKFNPVDISLEEVRKLELNCLIKKVEEKAKILADGHYTIHKFTTGYKGFFGTHISTSMQEHHDFRMYLQSLPSWHTLEECLIYLILNRAMYECPLDFINDFISNYQL